MGLCLSKIVKYNINNVPLGVEVRDCRGVAEPQGFGAGVCWGRGKGWNFCTPAKPLPSAGVQGYV